MCNQRKRVTVVVSTYITKPEDVSAKMILQLSNAEDKSGDKIETSNQLFFY